MLFHGSSAEISTLYCPSIMTMELSVPEASPPQRPSTTYSSLSELSKPFLIDPSQRSYKHQYANIYFVRLVELRPIVEERAAERWGGVRGELLQEFPMAVSSHAR